MCETSEKHGCGKLERGLMNRRCCRNPSKVETETVKGRHVSSLSVSLLNDRTVIVLRPVHTPTFDPADLSIPRSPDLLVVRRRRTLTPPPFPLSVPHPLHGSLCGETFSPRTPFFRRKRPTKHLDYLRRPTSTLESRTSVRHQT